MSDDLNYTVNICLFPEINTNDRGIVLDVYDHEAAGIKDRRKVGALVKGDNDPGWTLWLYLPDELRRRGWGMLAVEHRIGIYPYVKEALEDLAYVLGRYWSPNR